MNLTSTKTRLVQQLARLDKMSAEIKTDQAANSAAARQRIGEIDVRLEKLAPFMEKWIKASFVPDTPLLRRAAEAYCALVEERHDCLLAESLAEPQAEKETPHVR